MLASVRPRVRPSVRIRPSIRPSNSSHAPALKHFDRRTRATHFGPRLRDSRNRSSAAAAVSGQRKSGSVKVANANAPYAQFDSTEKLAAARAPNHRDTFQVAVMLHGENTRAEMEC